MDTQTRKILRMSYSRYAHSDIADFLGITVKRVEAAITRACAATADEARINVVREAELLKLEELDEVFMPAALEGSDKAAGVVFKAMERRAMLLGVDKAPPPQIGFTLVQVLSQMPSSRLEAPIVLEHSEC
jgi:hypothetical protein